eukprot:CAMPEP_0196665052 /NCGR_PEP_ID=MMETSP1086-20130531/59455_1 /TAXON_ID=77921 /ORGANISM="Cyanoptyche  gloeocystis , Strain SAG4.97" /LENGTH=237 /DNA_ID=CAMNT_0042001623 /DNA_START=69 /DNA_END=779 /DNA_ORIENTATION=-
MKNRDTWIDDFKKTEALADQTMALLQERARQQKAGIQPSLLSLEARTKLENLSTQITALDAQIGLLDSRNVQEREISRRRDMLSKLSHRRDDLVAMIRNVRIAPEAARAALLPNRDDDVRSRHSNGVETSATRALEAREILVVQNKMISHQDTALDALSQSITQTKHIGLAMGEELGVQTRLLDEVEDRVEKVDNMVVMGRKRIDRLIRNTPGFSTYCVLILVIIALVVVLFVLLGW